VAIGSTLVHPGIAQALYALVALSWLVPDRRIERVLMKEPGARKSDGSS
jgi:hypothetical protein